MHKTKIIATIGPACNSREGLRSLMRAGADILRLNGAHSSIEEIGRTVKLIRSVAKSMGRKILIQLDLPGPKFRIGKLATDTISLKKDSHVVIACGKKVQTDARIPLPERIDRTVKKGAAIFINDGIVELRVNRVKGRDIECTVHAGGEIRSGKGVNLPGTRLMAPALTILDKKLAVFAVSAHIDHISLSFVRSADDVMALRKLLRKYRPKNFIIAKIEKPEALEDLENIIAVSDAIMVARGDLGIEIPYHKLPVIQRHILARCTEAGKYSITATQMLESMVANPRPTRAEATDIATAIWQGSDAVMLSEETSIGKYPVMAVKAMANIAREAEKAMIEKGLIWNTR